MSGANGAIGGYNLMGTCTNTPPQTSVVTNALGGDNIGDVAEAARIRPGVSGTSCSTGSHGVAGGPALQDFTVAPTNSVGNASTCWASSPRATRFTRELCRRGLP